MDRASARSSPNTPARLASLLAIAFFLARRSLFESRLTAALLLGAVAAGTGFQVPNAANMLGYKAELLEEGVSSGLGDIRARPLKGAMFEDGDALAATIARDPSVRAAVPVLTLPGAAGKDDRFVGGAVTGIPSGTRNQPFRLLEGALLAPGDDKGVILGSSVASRLDVKVGDTIKLRVVLASGPTPLPEESLGRYAMIVRGLSAGAFGGYEGIFVDRKFLAEEAGTPTAASMVLAYMDDHSAAHDAAARIAPGVPEAQVRAWVDDSTYLRSTIRATDAVGAFSQAMVIAAVTLPVLALLYINVLHRRREVGVLSATGFGRGEIFVAFLMQALIVGVLGVLAGSAIGYALVRYFQANPIFEWEGFVIRPVLAIECFLHPALIVLGTTLVAGVYPAWSAARVDPARVLRGIE